MIVDKLIWVRADRGSTYEERKSIVTAALEAGLTDVIVRDDDDALRRLGRFNALTVRGDEVLAGDRAVARIVTISSPEDLDNVYGMRGVERLVISSRDWKVIPLENLIAAFQGSGTALMAEASGAEEARLFLETMEMGADGIVVDAEPEELSSIAKRRSRSGTACASTPAPSCSPERASW